MAFFFFLAKGKLLSICSNDIQDNTDNTDMYKTQNARTVLILYSDMPTGHQSPIIFPVGPFKTSC